MAPPITFILFLLLPFLASSESFDFSGQITCRTADRFSFMATITQRTALLERLISDAHLHVGVDNGQYSVRAYGQWEGAPTFLLIHHDCVNQNDRRHMTLRIPIGGNHHQNLDIDVTANGSPSEWPWPTSHTNYY